MIFAFDQETIVENTISLIHQFSDISKIADENSLKFAYLDFLRSAQPDTSLYIHETPDINIIDDYKIEEALVAQFNQIMSLNEPDRVTPYKPSSTSMRNTQVNMVKQAISYLKDQDSSIYAILKLYIHTIVVTNPDYKIAGTTQGAIGFLLSDLGSEASVYDFVELLVHELVHTTLFVDELCHTYFVDYNTFNREQYYVYSPLAQVKRPIDKTIHAFATCIELMYLRKNLLPKDWTPKYHPTSAVLIEDLNKSKEGLIDSMTEENLLSPRGSGVVEKYINLLEKFLEAK